jgi:tripartite-type tricarboxylate transporter receptor subunit TctC
MAAMKSGAALLPHIRSGRLRAIAVGTPARLPALPDVPTVAEMGYRNFESVQWYGILAPAGTPVEIVQRLQQESAKALQSPATAERFAGDNATIGGSRLQNSQPSFAVNRPSGRTSCG